MLRLAFAAFAALLLASPASAQQLDQAQLRQCQQVMARVERQEVRVIRARGNMAHGLYGPATDCLATLLPHSTGAECSASLNNANRIFPWRLRAFALQMLINECMVIVRR